jgi:hypothetical protein
VNSRANLDRASGAFRPETSRAFGSGVKFLFRMIGRRRRRDLSEPLNPKLGEVE